MFVDCVRRGNLLSGWFAAVWPMPAVAAAMFIPIASAQLPGEPTRATRDTDIVIVTARKAEEDRLSVPISMQVLGGEFLDTTSPTNLYELQFDVPGFVVASQGFFGAGLALRGVTDQGGSSLAVAPHFNGIYLGRSALILARPFDVERIEVLKGPQGTLYGRNATGGALNVIARRPDTEFSAAIDAALASFGTSRVQGHINVPAEIVGVRLAFAGASGNGFIRNAPDRRRFAADDFTGLRLSLSARPGPRTRFDVALQRVEDDGALTELWQLRRDFLIDAGDIRLTSVSHPDPFLELRNDIVSATFELELDALVVRTISGYAGNRTSGLDDCAGWPALAGCERAVLPLTWEQRSHEFQLAAPAGNRVDWIFGLQSLDGDERSRFQFRLGGRPAINDYTAARDDRARAVFGQATFPILARWHVTGGARVASERSVVATIGSGLADQFGLIAGSDTWRNEAWRVGIQFDLAPAALLYASVATGFKSGGLTTELLPTGEFDRFDPEQLLAREIGLNWQSAANRWRLFTSAFWYDFRDLQVRTTALVQARVTSVIDNAARARIRGLDVATELRLGDKSSLSAAIVWMPTRRFVEFFDALGASALAGNTLSRAPERSGSVSLTHRWAIRDNGQLTLRADYNFRTAVFFTKENDPAYSQESFGLLNLYLTFLPARSQWQVFAVARNVLDVDYFDQAFFQSSPGYPANFEIGFGRRFGALSTSTRRTTDR